MKIIRSLALAALFGLGSCVTASAENDPACEDGPCVEIGETQLVRERITGYAKDCPPQLCIGCPYSFPGKKTIRVTPLKVLVDKRCPIENWEECRDDEEFKVEVRIETGKEVLIAVLEEYRRGISIDGSEVALKDISPGKSFPRKELKPGDYRFSFDFRTPE